MSKDFSLDFEQDCETIEFPPSAPCSLNLFDVKSRRLRSTLTSEEFCSFLDLEGRVVDEHRLRHQVFLGGISKNIRAQVWQFLFCLYPFHSTSRERQVLFAEYKSNYEALKERWQTIFNNDSRFSEFLHPDYLSSSTQHSTTTNLLTASDQSHDAVPSSNDDLLDSNLEEQQSSFSRIQSQIYAGRQSVNLDSLPKALRVIDKDVPRTDRELEFFSGENNQNLMALRNVLITFASFNPELGYAQGMNDIASSMLQVFQSEVEAYWCFVKYMEWRKTDFLEDSILNRLSYVSSLLLELDPDLYKYLEHLGVSDMTFCYRWMLLSFKREFQNEDSLRCFEILSSHHMELSSLDARKTRTIEIRRDFEMQEGKVRIEEPDVDQNYTFDIFMCVTILIEHRKDIFACADASTVFEKVLHNSREKFNLDDIVQKSEFMFFKYCKKSVSDCFYMISNSGSSPKSLA